MFLLRGFVMIMKTDKIYLYMCKSPLPDDVLKGTSGLMSVIRKDEELSLVSRVISRMLYSLFME